MSLSLKALPSQASSRNPSLGAPTLGPPGAPFVAVALAKRGWCARDLSAECPHSPQPGQDGGMQAGIRALGLQSLALRPTCEITVLRFVLLREAVEGALLRITLICIF